MGKLAQLVQEISDHASQVPEIFQQRAFHVGPLTHRVGSIPRGCPEPLAIVPK
jgi:hypothetical protein